jgi:hypothetical protein
LSRASLARRLPLHSEPGAERGATISYEANLIDPNAAWLRLNYSANGHSIDYRVKLAAALPTYGGRRWWFLCPLVREDGGPPRRVTKLYQPSGGRYFGNREAYGLTYTSCQESDKFDGLFRSLAREMGVDVVSARRALKEL